MGESLPYPEYDYILNVPEVAEILGVSEAGVYAMTKAGKLSSFKLDGLPGRPRNMYHPDEVEALRATRDDRPYRTELTELEIQVAIRLYEGGKGLLYCRKTLGVGISRLYKIFRERGVEIRKPTRPDQR